MKLDNHWRQVDGDSNPLTYGCFIARLDGTGIELREIQPVREYVSEGEAVEVGFPFWSNDAWYELADLRLDNPRCRHAIEYADIPADGLDEYGEPIDSLTLQVMLACGMLRCGEGVDPGPCGWACDVVPAEGVYWYRGKRRRGPASFRDEDTEFRKLLRDHERDGQRAA